MQGNVLGQNGGYNGLNIFAQLNEPNKKDGIWIKTNEQYKYDNVYFINDYLSMLNRYEEVSNIPYNFYNGSAVAKESHIYILGTSLGGLRNNNYRYDLQSNMYTKLENIPYDFYSGGTSVIVGNNIHLLSGYYSNSNKFHYKYDIQANTYTKLTDAPYDIYNCSAVAKDNDIYILGGRYNYIYKYDTVNNEYIKTKENFTDNSLIGGKAVLVNNAVYLFGNGQKGYKYNILDNTFIELERVPFDYQNDTVVGINNNIFLLGSLYKSGSAYEYGKYNYKYDTLTNTYKKLEDIPYDFVEGSTVAIGNDIYLLGGSSSANNVYKYKTYLEKKNIFIKNEDDTLTTALNNILKIYFSEIIIYDNYESKDYPVYYGNGTEWVEII